MLVDCDSLLSVTTTWSQPFSRYFVDHVHPSIDRLGAWLLRPYGMESATTNQSEAFNFVLKRLQEWREAPIDAMALSLFRLSQFHYAEIQRGRCGQGDFCLRPGVPAVHSDVVPALRSRPDDIVAHFSISGEDLPNRRPETPARKQSHRRHRHSWSTSSRTTNKTFKQLHQPTVVQRRRQATSLQQPRRLC